MTTVICDRCLCGTAESYFNDRGMTDDYESRTTLCRDCKGAVKYVFNKWPRGVLPGLDTFPVTGTRNEWESSTACMGFMELFLSRQQPFDVNRTFRDLQVCECAQINYDNQHDSPDCQSKVNRGEMTMDIMKQVCNLDARKL